MQKVKDKQTFLKAVRAIASQENAGIFIPMFVAIFLKLPPQKKEMEFDFSHFDSDQEIITYIQSAIDILRESLPQQILLFDEVCDLDVKFSTIFSNNKSCIDATAMQNNIKNEKEYR